MKIGTYPLNSIISGDGRRLIKMVPDCSIDLVLSDPPFKISQAYTQNVDADNLIAVSSIWPLASQWFRVSKDGAYAAIYYDTRILPVAIEAMGEAGWKYLRGLTFYRRWGNANKMYGWMSTSDFILLFRKPSESPMQFYSDDWRHDVYVKDKAESESLGHLAQKPLKDVRHLVRHLCPAGGIVLDTYIGSGTTALAAMHEHRNFLGFERDRKMAMVARQRIKDFELPLFSGEAFQQSFAADAPSCENRA